MNTDIFNREICEIRERENCWSMTTISFHWRQLLFARVVGEKIMVRIGSVGFGSLRFGSERFGGAEGQEDTNWHEFSQHRNCFQIRNPFSPRELLAICGCEARGFHSRFDVPADFRSIPQSKMT